MPPFFCFSILASMLLLGAAKAQAADPYPSKPIRLVVNSSAGGPLDNVARVVAERASRDLQQAVVVENRAGAAGNIGANAVARATPDGYTLLMSVDTVVTVNPFAYRKMSFDPARDLEPVGLAGTFDQVLVAHPSLRTKSFAEFVSRSRQEDLSYASAGVASPGHITFELLKARVQIKGTHVAYKGNGPALSDVLAGQVPVGFLATPTAAQYIKAGKLIAMGTSGSKRDPLLPDVPTIGELGIANFEVGFAFILFLPAGTPAGIRTQWEQELRSVFADPGVKQKLQAQGVRAQMSNGAEATIWLSMASTRWGDLIRKQGIQLE